MSRLLSAGEVVEKDALKAFDDLELDALTDRSKLEDQNEQSKGALRRVAQQVQESSLSPIRSRNFFRGSICAPFFCLKITLKALLSDR